MNKYKGLFTFDTDNHRYVPVEQADGIINDMDYHPEQKEEPKECKYWYIDADDDDVYQTEDQKWLHDRNRKLIGNYFETKEEAEKAVEKLKALQRLKERFDLHITGWDVYNNQIVITTDFDFEYVRDRQGDGIWDDLDLLFNGNLIIRGEE